MITNSGKLTLSEKRKIEDLTKCMREKKRKQILDGLVAKRNLLAEPYNEKIAQLERDRDQAIRNAGYGKLYERGGFDTHPDLDKFDEETNKILIELWKGD